MFCSKFSLFFTREELGAYNTKVLGRGLKGYEGQIKNNLDMEKVNCIRKLAQEEQRERLWNKCVSAINKRMWSIRKQLLAEWEPLEIELIIILIFYSEK